MDINKYQDFAKKTSVYPKILVLKNPTDDQLKRCAAFDIELVDVSWIYPLIGLFGEAGEMANKLKKVIRDDQFIFTDEKLKQIIEEKGDLYWYSVILDYELKIEPSRILDLNIKKLSERKANNTIHDKGDRRVV